MDLESIVLAEFEKLVLIVLVYTGILCCWKRNLRGRLIYFFIHLTLSSILISYWVLAEIAFYFSVMNILSFILIFLYDRRPLKATTNRKFLGECLVPLAFVFVSISLGVFVSIKDKVIQSFNNPVVEIQSLNEYWEGYLLILAFTGFVLTCFTVEQKNKLKE